MAGQLPPPPRVKVRKTPWTCGHVASWVCAECFRELAAKAHQLAEENLMLRDRVAELTATVHRPIAVDDDPGRNNPTPSD